MGTACSVIPDAPTATSRTGAPTAPPQQSPAATRGGTTSGGGSTHHEMGKFSNTGNAERGVGGTMRGSLFDRRLEFMGQQPITTTQFRSSRNEEPEPSPSGQHPVHIPQPSLAQLSVQKPQQQTGLAVASPLPSLVPHPQQKGPQKNVEPTVGSTNTSADVAISLLSEDQIAPPHDLKNTIPSKPELKRPKTNRPFGELLGRSLLLRYHNDRVHMFTRLRGGVTTPEGIVIPTIRERLVLRKVETSLEKVEGAGHLYFLAPEKPLPIPLSQIATFDEATARATVAGILTFNNRDASFASVTSELKRQLNGLRSQLKSDVFQLNAQVEAVDLDGATATAQKLLGYCKRFGLNKLLAVTLQIFLCMNDILVIENIGTTFEEAVRAYLNQDSSGAQAKDVPDLTTVLELYTLLIGGLNVEESTTTNNRSTIPSFVKKAEDSAAHPQPQDVSGWVIADSSATGIVNAGPQLPQATSQGDSAARFHPTLFSAYNMSGSETGIAITRSHGSRPTAGQYGSISGSSAVRLGGSTGTTLTNGMISTGSFLQFQGFQMPQVLADEGERETQLQLIEQINVMLEVQQMLRDTLDYLILVLRYHIDQEWK